MRKLRYAILMLALCVPVAMVAQAGPDQGGGQPPRHRGMPSVDDQLADISKRLDLTDAQKPKVRAVLQERHDQMRQLMENSSGSREDNRAKMHEIHESSNAKIREILTDDQRAKFDKLQQEERQRMGGRHGGGDQGTAPPPQ